ncbi:60 kDa inner membrane insertion protein [Sulfuricella denitrificans skB26]|uniref:Membrane protein insertase YidC n=1 Tax=Sulfuricella denitrificans (strain DSM 22764 / NBRC 105220 / skB26) TaxID=1163617 RepID=S6B934_SULDS|nr:membrane protein insertase YidC [Sulfuricella denitrificans]BAN36832.1 60 kDa inner membrane insertion protein [Sulfuricella denitrificans skB26]
MDTQRLILFIVFSFSVLMLWDTWQKDQHPAPVGQVAQEKAGTSQTPSPTALPADAPAKDFGGPLQSGERVKVQTDLIYAEIDTLGGDVRRLELLKHHDTQDKSKNFVLLEDDPKHLYIAQSGLIGNDLPTHKTLFSNAATQYKLAEGANEIQARLTWVGANGVKVDKIFTFRKGSYVVDVAYEINNGSGTRLEPHAYFQLVRNGQPPLGNPKFVSTYTGFAVYTEKDKFNKISFSDIDKNKASYPKQSDDGWVAMVQHYFLSAWLPANQPREYYAKKLGDDLYDAGVILPVGLIEPGSVKKVTVPLYVGPQEQDHLSKVAPGLNLVVDYGILTVISAPLFWVLAFLNKLVHNWGAAIILLTILIKLAFYPLSAKSYRSMAQMRVLGPKLQKLKEQYGDDRQRLHTAMMELYKTEKVNPLGGCLPVVVQIPVFIALYWALLNSVEMRQAPFMLWIHDLSSPDPFYILPIVMGITMIIQTKLNPTPPDPIQAKVMMVMPIAFSVFFFFFPAGLVLYWVVNNTLSIAQQWYVTHGVEQEKVAAKRHGKH